MKKLPITHCVFCILMIGLIITIWNAVETDTYNISALSENEEVRPDIKQQISEDVREYKFSLEKMKGNALGFSFFSCHQEVEVYADGVLIHEMKLKPSVWERTTGSRWNFVEVPSGTDEIRIVINALFPQVRQSDMEFYMGNTTTMFDQLLRGSLLEVIISFLDMGIGLFMLGYSCFIRRKIRRQSETIYFGLVALIIGIWSFNETHFAVLLLTNRVASSFLAYACLMLLVPTYLLFIKCSLKVKNPLLPNLICAVCYANMVVCTILELAGVFYFREVLSIIFALIGIGLLYTVWAIFLRIRYFGVDHKVVINIIGSLMLSVAYVVDIYIYAETQMAGVFTKFGILIYIGLIGFELTKKTLTQVKKGQRAEFYRELAVTDLLTGIFNRNAYDSWVAEHNDLQDTMIITFDLNNLKQCNDTLGHGAGDQYIQLSAQIINETFESVGKSYRIGGDEFCVILPNASHVDVAQRLRYMNRIKNEYFQVKEASELAQIAYGIAIFDEEKDKNLEDTRNRADMAMYEHKRKLKEVEAEGVQRK